jgi:hypothetical protein
MHQSTKTNGNKGFRSMVGFENPHEKQWILFFVVAESFDFVNYAPKAGMLEESESILVNLNLHPV